MTDVLGVNDGQEAPVATKKPKTASRQPPARRTTKPTDAQAYYMRIADAVRQKASCDKRLVGAVIVLGNRIVSTGYNGTPEDMPNCNAGGCYRCAHPEQYGKGKGYDVCICVHAEQNALLTAARFGIGVEGADVYSTLAPCFTCMKELLQAKVKNVYYLGDLPTYENDLDTQVQNLVDVFKQRGGVALKVDVPGVDPHLSRADIEAA